MLQMASDPSSEFVQNGNKGLPVDKRVIDDYRSAVDSIDSVIAYDWGVYNIVSEEISSHYSAGKTTDEIASSLQSRIDLYVDENYR